MIASCASLRGSLSVCLGALSSALSIVSSSRTPAATSDPSFFHFFVQFYVLTERKS